MKISLIQWNILYKEPIQNIAKFLKQNPTDIICLQELTIGFEEQNKIDAPKYIANELGYNYHFSEMPVTSPEGEKGILANGIFSRFEIVNKFIEILQKPGGSGHPSDETRTYVEVKLKNGSELFSVGTVHLSYNGWFINNAKKQKESNNLIKIIKQKKHKYILCGDFNSRPNSYTIRNIKKYLRHAGPAMSEETWTTKPFRIGNFAEDKLNWRLDYVFATPDIKVTKAEVLKTDYSDHLPVRVEFEV